MQEQILMPYTDLRNRGTEQEISQSGQQFIEIDNPVRTTGLDTLTNVVIIRKSKCSRVSK